MPVKKLSVSKADHQAILDEIFVSLLDILDQSNQVLSREVVITEVSEIESKQWAIEDCGYPFSYCQGTYFEELLAQWVCFQGRLIRLVDALVDRSGLYRQHKTWLDQVPIDELFAIRPTSVASVGVVESVQSKTLAVMDALTLLSTLRSVSLAPGQLVLNITGGPKAVTTAGISYPTQFRVVEADWVFEPIMTLGEGHTDAVWFTHALVHALYHLVLGGGSVSLRAFDGGGGFSLSLHTLRSIDSLGIG